MKDLHEMKEFEFSELLENTKFTSVEEERKNKNKTKYKKCLKKFSSIL